MLLPQDFRSVLTRIALDMEQMSLVPEVSQTIFDRTYLAQLGVQSSDQAGEVYDVLATCIAAYLAAPERLQMALWTAALFWSDSEKRESPNFHAALYWANWKLAFEALQNAHEPPGSGHNVCPN